MIFNKIIYFDWSGTLAYPRTRHELLKGNKNVLYKDTILTLSKLRQKGYIIGIISNTKMPRDMFIKGLEKIDLLKSNQLNIEANMVLPEVASRSEELLKLTAEHSALIKDIEKLQVQYDEILEQWMEFHE